MMSPLLHLKDLLRHSPFTRTLTGGIMWLGGNSKGVKGRQLARALELSESPWLTGRIIESLKKAPGFGQAVPWLKILESNLRYSQIIAADPGLTRSILLKAPSEDGEKGVLLMTFEYNWARLLAGLSDTEFQWLDQHYDLVLSASWSATDYAALGCALSRTKGTVFVQSCNYDEIPTIEAFHPRLRCLPTLPCDWINPELYQPLPASERTTDIIMVANWGEFKRHWDLFRALARMPEDLKVVLIGQKESGRTKETIQELARSFKVRQNLEFHESVPIHEVVLHQCRAKVSVIMSRREGCCVAAVESLFAGCALAMREDAHVGPLAYITPATGRRLRPARIAEDLLALVRQSGQMRPHLWALENLSCHVSRIKVNDLLKAEALKSGRPWTRDIIQPQWRPHPTYTSAHDKEAVRSAFEDLHSRLPSVFPARLLEESWR